MGMMGHLWDSILGLCLEQVGVISLVHCMGEVEEVVLV